MPLRLQLEAEARRQLQEFERELEQQLAQLGLLGHMPDFGGKSFGAVARLTANLHMATHALDSAPWNLPVQVDTVERGIAIGEYCIAHARAAYAQMGADPDIAAAEYTLNWIERTQVRSFSKRDAFEALRSRFERVTDLEPALKLLEEHLYIRPLTSAPRTGPGRRPSPQYEVNPMVWDTHNSHNAQNRAQPTDVVSHTYRGAGTRSDHDAGYIRSLETRVTELEDSAAQDQDSGVTLTQAIPINAPESTMAVAAPEASVSDAARPTQGQVEHATYLLAAHGPATARHYMRGRPGGISAFPAELQAAIAVSEAAAAGED